MAGVEMVVVIHHPPSKAAHVGENSEVSLYTPYVSPLYHSSISGGVRR
ncbi:hypothetical protein ABID59_005353 [Bradyrhizobium sp. S3.3.6]